MKLKFYWYISEAYKDGILRPACKCINPKEESDEYIANYLMDDGGSYYLDSIPWLEEGLAKISLIKSHKINYIDWSRNAWGAELSTGGAKIYSLYDESFFRTFTLTALEEVLFEWKKFLQLEPEMEKTQEVTLKC
jgi:hypothetical protein